MQVAKLIKEDWHFILFLKSYHVLDIKTEVYMCFLVMSLCSCDLLVTLLIYYSMSKIWIIIRHCLHDSLPHMVCMYVRSFASCHSASLNWTHF